MKFCLMKKNDLINKVGKNIINSYKKTLVNTEFSFFEYEDGSFSKGYYKKIFMEEEIGDEQYEFIVSECSQEEYYINKPSGGGFYCGG